MNTPSLVTITTRPIHQRTTSYSVWLVLMAYLVAVKLLITVVPATFRSVSQAGVFDWPFLAVWAIAGLIGIFFAQKTGFPNAWDGRVSHRQRFFIPVLLGISFSVAFIAHDLLTHYSRIMAAQHGVARANIDFPVSLLIYPAGAVVVEVFYRLFALPLLLWLGSNVLLNGRGQMPLFVVLAILTSLIEPLTQDLDALSLGVTAFGSLFALDFMLNVAQVVLFRKYGFLAAIVMRVAFYLIWHVVYVH
jgi:hypothetical protein